MLETHDHGEVRELRLARPPVNALNPPLVAALCDAIEKGGREKSALVLSGSPGIFTAGLDLPELLALDRNGMRDAWRGLFDLMHAVAASPVPIVAAITGHSPAGGAVVSLYADRRIMAEGDYRIGFNEVQIGIVLPRVIYAALRRLLGARAADRLAVTGDLVGPQEALRLGIVDALLPLESVVPHAIELARHYVDLPRRAMLETRRQARRDLVALFDSEGEEALDAVVGEWFRPETQEKLHATVARLKKKRP